MLKKCTCGNISAIRAEAYLDASEELRKASDAIYAKYDRQTARENYIDFKNVCKKISQHKIKDKLHVPRPEPDANLSPGRGMASDPFDQENAEEESNGIDQYCTMKEVVEALQEQDIWTIHRKSWDYIWIAFDRYPVYFCLISGRFNGPGGGS